MNKHLFKSLQEDKRIELNKMYNAYERMAQFYRLSNEYAKKWTLTEYNCFWTWYYHSDLSAREAYHYAFEED